MNSKMDTRGQPPPYPGTTSEGRFDQPTQYMPSSVQGFPPSQQYGQYGQYNQAMTSTNIVVQAIDRGGMNIIQAAPVDYTTQAYIACLCCFMPTGILAIMKAQESRDALAVGDLPRAHAASNSARSMVRISYAIGGISMVIATVIVIVYVAIIMTAI